MMIFGGICMEYDYEEYGNKQKAVHEANKAHLANFKECLKNKGLAKKTINNHVFNVNFYINDFLCYYDALDVQQGCYKISEFLGDWFIRKAMWSSCAHIKSIAAGVKKFYALMLECGVVKQEDYDELCETIKDEMPGWLNNMKRYEDEDMDEDYYF